jgi:hypothetical protein
MKDYIKSRIAGYSIFLFFMLMFFGVTMIGIGLPQLVRRFAESESIGVFLILLFIVGLFLLEINFLKDIRYLQIKDNKLKFWSLFVPWGRTLNFDNYIGKIIEMEIGSGGSYEVVYLVDKKRRTAFKIMGLHYKNFDEINKAIPLKKISFLPSVGQYFKLLFFEHITIPDKKAQKQTKNKNSGHNIAKIFAVISAVGVVLFALGMLVKILSKLL